MSINEKASPTPPNEAPIARCDVTSPLHEKSDALTGSELAEWQAQIAAALRASTANRQNRT